MGRVIIAGIVGGLIIFVWSFVAHEFLPIGEMGLHSLPDNVVLETAFKTAVPKPGVYLFPGMDMSHKPTQAEQDAWAEKAKAGPTGMLLLYPKGREFKFTRALIFEGLGDLIAALLGAWIISKMAASYGCRFIACVSFGVIAWMLVNLSYWNWYGFPKDYVIGEAIDIVGGWFLAGILLAAMAKSKVVAVVARV